LPWSEGFEVIRQAISCDICATEKRQTNHWFVAYEQAGELRVSGWTSRHKLRPGSKHLCGQTCLHKLVDEFMAKALAVRAQRPPEEPVEQEEPVEPIDPEPPAASNAGLASSAVYPHAADPHSPNLDPESSARIVTPPAIASPPPVLPKPAYRPQPELLTMPQRPHSDYTPTVEEPPRYASRNWRAEAWERERLRELRAAGNRPGIAARRASNA